MAKEREEIPASLFTGIPKDRAGDPAVYVDKYAEVVNAALEGKVSDIAAKRLMDILKDACEKTTGVVLEDAAKSRVDPVEKVLSCESMLECTEHELVAAEAAYHKIDDIRLTEEAKKKFSRLVRRTIRLQHEARMDPAKFTAYVGRDSEDGSVFSFADIHIFFFDVWNDVHYPNSLIMAPPGHGKSTLLRHYVCWCIGKRPERRVLYLTDESDKACREVRTARRIIASLRYRAIFPHIRILGRAEKEQDTFERFTVSRPNSTSREPTLEGHSIMSNFNGKGYDLIVGDDFSSPEVRNQEYLRRIITERWTSIVEERTRNPATARIMVICTPWHEDDTACVLSRQIQEGRLKRWRCEIDRFRIRDDAQGRAVPIWGKFDSEFLEEKKVRLGEIRYNCNYRLVARTQGTQVVRFLSWYHSIPNHKMTTEKDRELLRALSLCERWLSIDPSASAGRESSDHGVVEFALTQNGYAFATNCWFHHMPPGQMEDWIVDQIASQPSPGYAGVQIEAQGGIKGMVSGWMTSIRRKLTEMKCPYAETVQFVQTGTRMDGVARQNISKLQRLAESSGMIEHGLVRLAGVRAKRNDGECYFEPVRGSAMERLADNLLSFDGSQKGSDGVDAFTQWILVNRDRLNNPSAPAPPVEKSAEEPEEGRLFAARRAILSRTREELRSGDEEAAFWRERSAG